MAKRDKSDKIEVTIFEFLFWCSTPYLLCQFLHLIGQIESASEANFSGLVGVAAAVLLNLFLCIIGKERIIGRRDKNSKAVNGAGDDDLFRGDVQMRVKKDFGDILRSGEPKKVYARMVEVRENMEKPLPELTAGIAVTSPDGLQIRRGGMEGGYLVATLIVPDSLERDTADVIFTLGGIYTLTLSFQIENENQPIDIVFPESPSQYDMNLDVIAGDNGTYRVLFFFHNTNEEPESVRFSSDSDFNISCEQGPYERSFYAIIKNLTTSEEPTPFAKPREVSVDIYAEFPTRGSVTGDFKLWIYPEGITVRCYDLKRDRMLINAYEDEQATEWDYKVRPTSFEVHFAVSRTVKGYTEAQLLHGKTLGMKFHPLTGNQDYADTFGKTFSWEINRYYESDGHYSFVPKVVLPQKDPYEVELPISCSYDGTDYNMDVPLLIKGKDIPKAPSDWDKEMANLKKDIMYFGLSQNEEIRAAVRNAKSLSANEICMLRRAIISEAMVYYTREGDEFTKLDQSLAKYEFAVSVYKWFIDQAFTYCVIACCHGNTTYEAFLTPLKDMIGEFLGEYTASAYWGTPCTAECDLVRVAVTGTERTCVYRMRDAILSGKLKQAGGALAAFMFIYWLDKYFMPGETQGDIYKATVSTLTSGAATTVKLMFLAKFKEFVDATPAIRDTLHKFFFNAVWKKVVNDKSIPIDKAMDMLSNASAEATHTLGLAIKYLTEFVGLSVTVFLQNAEKQTARLGEKVSNVINYDKDINSPELDSLFKGMYTDKEKELAAKKSHLLRKSIRELVDRGTFDIDIKIGGSVIRFNIMDNIDPIANFVFETMFGVMLPKKESPADLSCKQYYKNTEEALSKLRKEPTAAQESEYEHQCEQAMLGQ